MRLKDLQFKALVLVVLTLYLPALVSAQTSDSCSIAPNFTASIDGLSAKGMMNTTDLEKIKKLIPAETGLKIIGFTYSIDCDNCEMIVRRVNSDSFSEEDRKVILDIKSRQILSFECIIGLNKKGELIAYKPFLYYIR